MLYSPNALGIHPFLQAALLWCLAVQECTMYSEWPSSVAKQWPEECDNSGNVIFRGPRCGVALGSVQQ